MGERYEKARAWAKRVAIERLEQARSQEIQPYEFEMVAEEMIAAGAMVNGICEEERRERVE